MERVVLEVAERLRDNYPYFHPLYAGQMLKPPHPVARLASMLAMWINPNNHALDGGRASSRMEKEAVSEIAAMFGWKTYLGHLTGGGTMANLEALWVANRLSPAGRIVASEQAHYTHSRISAVLKLEYEAIPCDRRARMELEALKRRLDQGGIGTVVATIGTTATGSIDPLPELLKLREQYGFRIHADSAYGGYFRLADNLTAETAASTTCFRRSIPSSLTRTNTASSPTDVVVCCSRTPASAVSTSTTRRILTSARTSCTSAKSAWNARGPGQQRSDCGPRRNCSP